MTIHTYRAASAEAARQWLRDNAPAGEHAAAHMYDGPWHVATLTSTIAHLRDAEVLMKPFPSGRLSGRGKRGMKTTNMVCLLPDAIYRALRMLDQCRPALVTRPDRPPRDEPLWLEALLLSHGVELDASLLARLPADGGFLNVVDEFIDSMYTTAGHLMVSTEDLTAQVEGLLTAFDAAA